MDWKFMILSERQCQHVWPDPCSSNQRLAHFHDKLRSAV